MRAGIKITYLDDSTADTVAIVADFIAWERKFRRKASDLANGVAIEDLAFLAWSSLHRTKQTGQDFDEFCGTVAEVEMVNDNPKATKRAPSKDS